ncbi:MAG: 50S ribosomal protein L10 [Candidatus Magasanikbacteria bacterium]
MAKTKVQKEEAMQALAECLKTAKGVVFANFQGLKVSESEELRGKCREQGMHVIATKKTLLRRSLSELGINVETKAFDGGVAVICGDEDEVAPAQTVAAFAKNHDVLTIFGGTLEGKYIDNAMVTRLSKLPNKQQLLGQVVGTIYAPVSGFVNVLAGNLRGLMNVLNGIKEAKA